MKERPILFSAPMVRAILEGRKTQTRRVFKIRGVDGAQYAITSPAEEVLRFDDGTFHYLSTAALSGPYPCLYGQPGDRLWVRESFSGPYCMEAREGCAAAPPSKWGRSSRIWYWADGNPDEGDWTRPRPSIHMPRWASRILLEVTDVRVERVQAISASDAVAEGIDLGDWSDIEHDAIHGVSVVDRFRELWDSINAKRGFGWDANPHVWAITFKRLEPRA